MYQKLPIRMAMRTNIEDRMQVFAKFSRDWYESDSKRVLSEDKIGDTVT